MTQLVLEPDWIVPIESSPIQSGRLVVDAGRIVFIGQDLPPRFASLPSVRLERSALLPGFINSHCHLEFSDFATPIPVPNGGTIVSWLAQVMAHRRSQASTLEEQLEQRRTAIHRGILESWRSGTRWIVDNVTEPWEGRWIDDAVADCRQSLSDRARETLVPETLLRVQPCFEIIDVTPSRFQQTRDFFRKQLDAPKYASLAAPGIAPHAPYTASLSVTQAAASWSGSLGRLLTMHLAESREELAWLDRREGPLGGWIAPFLDSAHREGIGRVSEHLEIIAALAHRALVVHGNYLSPREIQMLAGVAIPMGLVVCPRTHAHFGHDRHPIWTGDFESVAVFLGTDSRASNPDLSMWEELRWSCNNIIPCAPSQAVRQCTLAPARFLEIDSDVGALRVGGLSQLTLVSWDEDQGELSSMANEDRWLKRLIDHGRASPLECHPWL
jgi:cytosine/adenosine deaminase-related metal-dependent hydrolase